MPTLLHEVRNPLTAATTTLEVLLEEVDADAGRLQRDLAALLAELQRIQLLLDGVGGVGRQLRCSRPASIDASIRQTCGLLRARAESRGVQLSCELPSLPPLRFDPGVVRALVFNLVSNALQASLRGGRVAVRARLDGADFLLEVADEGEGMSEELRRTCTELFVSTRSHGSGIGLTLCAEACASAGGRLEIASRPGEGTRVVARIPLEPPDEPGRPSDFPAARRAENP